MANFFSLGSCSNNNNNAPPVPPVRSELPNPQQLFHLENLNGNSTIAAANSWNSGVLLYRNKEIYQKGFEIWQQYMQVHHPKSDPHRPFLVHHHHVMQSGARPPSDDGGEGLLGGINCQDCGNQAKKDCAHLRCRACCKSHDFDCPTHMKNTWVPAAQRREHQQRLANSLQRQSQKQPQTSDEDHTHQLMRLKRQRQDTTCLFFRNGGSVRMRY